MDVGLILFFRCFMIVGVIEVYFKILLMIVNIKIFVCIFFKVMLEFKVMCFFICLLVVFLLIYMGIKFCGLSKNLF